MAQTSLACRGCGSHDITFFLDLGDQPHCNRLIPAAKASVREPYFPLRLGFCHACTLVQIDHTIPKEDMFTDYPYVSGTTKTLVAHFKETAERLVQTYDLKPGARVVDVGSNDGTWLKQYQPLGLSVLGIDPAANVTALANAAGVPTWTRFFNESVAEEILREGRQGRSRHCRRRLLPSGRTAQRGARDQTPDRAEWRLRGAGDLSWRHAGQHRLRPSLP